MSGHVIACQGTEGAYSQLAAKKLFPDGSFLYFRNFEAVATAVREDLCEFGVLPIENNTYGSVRDVYRILARQEVSIVRGCRLQIRHQLLANPGAVMSGIRKVYSHEQGLGQCAKFLHTLGDKVSLVPCLNTAVAARMVAESGDMEAAAISSPECADLYGLTVLKRGIADSDHNYTRFLCIAKESCVLPGADRISLIFTLPHRPGALACVLGKFADADMNLLKLESAPIPGRDFEFLFYADVEGSVNDPAVSAILEEIRGMCPDYRFLGNYHEI